MDVVQALFGQVDQIGYVVVDLDAAVARWTERTGLGPWTVFRNSRLEGRYRGSSTTVVMDVALAYQGGIQIELIGVRSSTPSPYAHEGRPLAGVHHIAWVVDDLDRSVAAAEARGLAVAFTAGNAAVRVAYLESPGEEGVLYELIEGAGMREMIAAGIAASAQWDGRNPVTEIDLQETGQG
jgi:methylmalonyl-CoA/ethylmalonyl-CoA epimerase